MIKISNPVKLIDPSAAATTTSLTLLPSATAYNIPPKQPSHQSSLNNSLNESKKEAIADIMAV